MGIEVTIPNEELNEFDLPRVCLLSGGTEGVVFKEVKLSWYPRWLGLLILLNVLIAAVVIALTTKRVKGRLPFTEPAYAAWRRGVWVTPVAAIVAVVLGFTSVMLGTIGESSALAVALIAVTLGGGVLVWMKLVRGKVLEVTRITKTHTTLRLPSEEAAARLRAHLTGGRRAPSPV